jgi:hypothetical protein
LALSEAVRGPISGTAFLDRRVRVVALPIVWAAFLTLLVAGPWLAGGYIFGTDWPGPRRFPFPVEVSSSAALQAAIAVVARVISGEAAGKVFIVGLLFVAAMTSYVAVPAGGFVPRAIASIVYTLNPFVYGRLHYGQLFLLAGYAVLPWVALRLRRLFLEPRLASALLAAASVTLLGVLSLHILVIAGVLGAALLVAQIIAAKNRLEYGSRIAPAFVIAVGVSLAVSAYWIVPILRGTGPEGSLLGGIAAGNAFTFASVPDPHLGLVPNLVGLYGFWAENSGRFTSMKDFVPLWPVVLAVVLTVGALGAIAAFRQRRDCIAAWAAGLLIAALISLVLEMGVSHPLTSWLVTWLDLHFAIYRGMRDAGKWAALLALVYSQLVALGAVAILDWLRQQTPATSAREWVVSVATGLLLAVSLYYGNGLLFGMHGEIQPSQYPSGWYAADLALLADPHPGLTLFLPWHEYMSFSFVHNQNPVIAPPAPAFFSVPVIVSANPEVTGIAPPTDPQQAQISTLVAQGEKANWAEALAILHVKYVLVARGVSFPTYRYLDKQPGLTRVGDFTSIVIYRNILVP